jgi:hypothetical protein
MNHATRAEYNQPTTLDRLSGLTSPIQSAADAGYLFRVPAAILMVFLAACAVVAGFVVAYLVLKNAGAKAFLYALASVICGLGVASMCAYRAQAILDIPSSDDLGAGFTIHRIVREYLVASGEACALVLALMGVFGGIQAIFESNPLLAQLRGVRGWAILLGPLAGFCLLALTHLLAGAFSVLFRIAETSARTADAAEQS